MKIYLTKEEDIEKYLYGKTIARIYLNDILFTDGSSVYIDYNPMYGIEGWEYSEYEQEI